MQIDRQSGQPSSIGEAVADNAVEQVDVDIAAADHDHDATAAQLRLQFERTRQSRGSRPFGEQLHPLEEKQHRLANAGRLTRLSIDLHDRPGELQKLLALVSECAVNVRAIEHDRARRDISIGGVRVILELETRGADHIRELRQRLIDEGYRITTQDGVSSKL